MARRSWLIYTRIVFFEIKTVFTVCYSLKNKKPDAFNKNVDPFAELKKCQGNKRRLKSDK
jgi:hypothetical protein